ncbi:MAG: deoxyribodipyrimidine photolyase, partial [Acidobacteriota bacterium]|nr:deoxyribodipyrimidine photolyase [Acidobacteriota bacterium]
RLTIPALKRLPPGLAKWPRADVEDLETGGAIARLPIDHDVGPVPVRGGERTAVRALRRFVRDRLERYAADRNEPEEDGTSGLSPWLHFGHVSAHQVFAEVVKHEGWGPPDLGAAATGKRSGWWGVSEPAEGFLDQLVTWRELGFNFCCRRDDYEDYDSLPDWARGTLAEHLRDPRPHVYPAAELEQARTHDPLWNAAQTQLVREGRLHNYLRMLWGKKILEWSETPRKALDVMIELNNRYALDGRDPNSYSGIFWVLGRYDRPWGPERPIFGKIRYMSSANTARKLRVRDYIKRYTPGVRH